MKETHCVTYPANAFQVLHTRHCRCRSRCRRCVAHNAHNATIFPQAVDTLSRDNKQLCVHCSTATAATAYVTALAAAVGPTLGEMTESGLWAGVGGAVPPIPDRSLLRMATPRTAATTNVAATSPRRAPDELFDSIVNNLSGPGR